MEKLKEKKGDMLVTSLGFLMIIIVVAGVVLEIIQIYTVVNHTREKLNESIVSINIENLENGFNGIREASSKAIKIQNGGYVDNLKEGDVFEYLSKSLELEKQGSNYIKYKDGKEMYRIYDLELTQVNGDNENNINTKAAIKIKIPFKLFDTLSVTFTLKSESEHISKF